MNIYTAENATKKLLDFSNGIVKTDSNFYRTTIQKLLSISESIDVIQHNLKSVLSKSVDCNPTDIQIEEDDCNIQQKSDNTNASTENKIKSENSKAFKKMYVHKFLNMILHANIQNDSEFHVNQCMNLIYNWCRLRIESKTSRYKVDRLKDSICSIVILYGYYLEHDMSKVYVSEFNEWLLNFESKQFCLPFKERQVFNATDDGKEYGNKTAVVLYAKLYEKVFYTLSDVTVYGDSAFTENTMTAMLHRIKFFHASIANYTEEEINCIAAMIQVDGDEYYD